MGEEPLDCSWCGSARSIEHGICQICMMEYPLETRIIHLPSERPERTTLITVDLAETEEELGVAE